MSDFENPDAGRGERLPEAYTTFGNIKDLNPFFVTYLEQLPTEQQAAAKNLSRDELVAQYETRYIEWMGDVMASIPEGN